MSKPFLKRISYISLIVVVFLGLFLINVNEARAISARSIALDMVKIVFQALLSIAQLFTGLCGQLFTAILDFGFQNMEVVKAGWQISRDTVNMFFILALVVIAFATILRIETYGIKTLLPKFIIIALLINFSFLICGIIIDATQIATKFFQSGIKNDDIGQALIDATRVTVALKQEPMTISAAAGELNKDIRLILSMSFTLIVIGIVGIMLLIGSILLFVRIGALWILMILAPFAWFLGVFPKFKGMNDKWWDNFLKYAFFAPIYVFFLYLIIRLSQETIELKVLSQTPDALKALTLGSMLGGNIQLLFAYVFIVILSLAAPVVAMSMGIHGASAVTGFAKGAFKGTAKMTGKWAGTRAGARARQMFKPEKMTRFLAEHHKIPGFKALGRAAGTWAAKGTNRIHEESKKIPDLPENELANLVKVTTDPYKKMGLIEKLSQVATKPENLELVQDNLAKHKAMGGNTVRDVIANNLTFARTNEERNTAAGFRVATGKTTLSKSEAEDVDSVEAIRTAMGTEEFVKAARKMPDAIQAAIFASLRDSANDSSTPLSGIALEQRTVAADITGRIAEAFMDATGAINPAPLKEYVHRMEPIEFGRITGNINISNVAQSVDESTARAARRHLSKAMADTMGHNFTPDVQKKLRDETTWASNIP